MRNIEEEGMLYTLTEKNWEAYIKAKIEAFDNGTDVEISDYAKKVDTIHASINPEWSREDLEDQLEHIQWCKSRKRKKSKQQPNLTPNLERNDVRKANGLREVFNEK